MTVVSSKEYLICASNEDDDGASDLAEAKERANDENTNADDFIRYLRAIKNKK